METTLLPKESRILTELFVLDQGTAYGFSIKELNNAFNSTSQEISPRDIAIALGTLRSKGLTTREEHENGDWLWSITPHGTEIFTGLKAGELEDETAKKKIPAADRYVNAKDNQLFLGLGRSLSEIRDEFKKDHNKGDIGSDETTLEVLGEIDGTLAQIQRGRVRLGQLVDGLDPSLRKMLPYVSAYPGLCKLIKDALDLLQTIVTAFGH